MPHTQFVLSEKRVTDSAKRPFRAVEGPQNWVQGWIVEPRPRTAVENQRRWFKPSRRPAWSGLKMAKAEPVRVRPSWVQGLDLNQRPSGYEPACRCAAGQLLSQLHIECLA
jgi:hypothetical protein